MASLTLPTPGGQTVLPSGQGIQAQASPGAFAAPWSALEQGADQFTQNADWYARRQAERQQQHDMVAAGSKVVAQTRWDLTQQLQQAKDGAAPGAPGFTPAFMKTVDDTIAERTKGLDPQVQDYVSEHLGQLRDTLGIQSMNFEAAASLAKRQQDLDTTVNLHANTVRSDPSQFEAALGETLGAVAGSGIEATGKKDAELHVKNVLAASAVEGMIDRDPGHAVSVLNGGGFDAFLSPTAKNTLLERATALHDRDAREGQAQYQSTVRTAVNNEFASLEDSGQSTGSALVAPAAIKATFGADAPAIMDQLDLARRGYNARQTVALTSPQEDADIVKGFQPDNAKVAEGVPYKELAGERDSVVRAIDDKYRAFDRDPAAYVQQASPALQAAYKAAQADPTKMPAAIALSDQLQAKLAGAKPGDDFAPSVLSTAQARDVAAKITAAPVDQAGPAIAGLQQQYGDAWPRVWADLQTKGKLPPSYQVLGTIDDPNARTDLAAALKTKPSELDANAGEQNARAAKAAVGDQLAGFSRTLSVVPNGDSQIAAYRSSAEVLALHYVGQGMTPEAAATKAVTGLVASRYDVATDTGYNARAPKGTLPLVQAYAAGMMDRLTPADVKAPEAQGIDEQTRQRVYFQDHVQQGGQWVSQGDDRWMLLDSSRRPVLTKDGQPVTFLVKDALTAPPPGATTTDAHGNLHPTGQGPLYRLLYGQ